MGGLSFSLLVAIAEWNFGAAKSHAFLGEHSLGGVAGSREVE